MTVDDDQQMNIRREAGTAVSIEFTRKDGTLGYVERVTDLDMDGPLEIRREGRVIYMVAAGEWTYWRVVPGSRRPLHA